MIKNFNLLSEYPNFNITVKAGELMEMAEYIVKLTYQELGQQVADANSKAYLTRNEVSEMLGIDKSTLWRWNKKKYLVHIEVGGKRLYRMSDVKQILNGGK